MKVDCDGRGEDPPPFLLLCRGGTHRAHTILSFRPLLSWSTNCFRITGEEEGDLHVDSGVSRSLPPPPLVGPSVPNPPFLFLHSLRKWRGFLLTEGGEKEEQGC